MSQTVINQQLTAAKPTTAVLEWKGGPGTMLAQGNFDGGTLQLQFSLDGTTWTNVPGTEVTLSGPGGGNFQLCFCSLRAQLSGAGGSADVAVRVANNQGRAQ